MKRIILIFAALVWCAGVAAAGRVHRVASCNIRVALDSDEEAGNGWSTRKTVCEKAMKRLGADIYCLQEVAAVQARDLRKMFPGYEVLGYEGPEMDAMPDDTYRGVAKNLVLYSRSRYELRGAGCYWLSETPLVGGSLSWGTARARHVNWVRLRDRRSGFEFRVISIHLDHISAQARVAQIDCFIGEAGQYPATFPQLLVGDFNSRPGDEPAQRLARAGWTDVFRRILGDEDNQMSHHGFKGADYVPKGKPGRIDYIYLKGDGLKAVDARIVKDAIEGKYPSDHYFLVSNLVER